MPRRIIIVNEHDIKDMWPDQQYRMDAFKQLQPLGQFVRKHPPQVTPGWNSTMIPEANAKQVGGEHYKKYGDFQPWDAVIAWNLGYLEGTALKYIARWKDKNGIEDIKKAIHFLEKLVEVHDKK